MRLLSGARLREAITRICRGKSISCAVAFWGRGADDLIGNPEGRTIRLICNLKMGGTNPDVIAALMESDIRVRQSNRLHAKVYIGDTQAVITSANASINGLGLEGDELAGWIETGVEVPAQEALPWFDKLWAESKPITPQNMDDARRIFRERAIVKPTRPFADFHPTRDDFPLVGWARECKIDYNDAEIEKVVGYVNDTVHQQIDYGLVDIEGPEDVALFRRGV
jgi:hypothetical protein